MRRVFSVREIRELKHKAKVLARTNAVGHLEALGDDLDGNG